MVTPFTLFKASPTVLSGVFLMNSTEMPSETETLFLTILTTATLDSFFPADLIVTSDIVLLKSVSCENEKMGNNKNKIVFLIIVLIYTNN